MPIYEYRCSGCGLKFELLRSMSAAKEDASCPRCQAAAPRLVSTFAAFSKGMSGAMSPIAGGAPSCAGCAASAASDCSTCH